MRIFGFQAPVFGACCYLVAADDGTCVVVDPGGGVADDVALAVVEHGLRIAGVVATHGHADHVWDAGRVAAAAGVPLRLHERDAYRIADPLGTTDGGGRGVADSLVAALRANGLAPDDFEAGEVEPFGAGDGPRTPDVELTFGSVTLTARHAPGHTEGSTLYLLAMGDERVAFTGDVLFAGTIGRTDLPGGDSAAMTATLREVVAALPPGTHVMPGHGPASRMDAELATNPYLAG